MRVKSRWPSFLGAKAVEMQTARIRKRKPICAGANWHFGSNPLPWHSSMAYTCIWAMAWITSTSRGRPHCRWKSEYWPQHRGKAVMVGMERAVREMKEAIRQA